MGNKRITKKFKTLWNAKYIVYVNDTSDVTVDDEPPSEIDFKHLQENRN